MSNKKIELAGCMIVGAQGQVLLLHRDNGRRNQWELPGGKVDYGESPKQAAVREVMEELGVGAILIKKAGETTFLEEERELHYVWYLATIGTDKPSIKEPQTFKEWRYWSWKEMEAETGKLSTNVKKLLEAYHEKQLELG